MIKLGVGFALAASLFLAACGGRAGPSTVTEDFGGRATPAPRATATPAPKDLRGPAGPAGPAGLPAPAAPTPSPRPAAAYAAEQAAASLALDVAQRQVIATGAITIEVQAVAPAIAQVRAIAEGLGGFVEQLTSAGDTERQQATMTIRVPQAQFFTALERLEALGKVQGRNLGSQDVTEQFIDLEARLQSALRQERSLLSLLDKTQSVSEVLTIERELARVRSEIERLQGQLNFLKRRVELATITVALVPPKQELAEPPSASLAVQVSDVAAAMDSIKGAVASLGGVLDRASLSERNGRQTGKVALRVFAAQFDQALRAIEGQGRVTNKDVSEGRTPKGGEAARPQEPDARIEVSLAEGRTWWRIVVGAVVLAALAGGLAYGAYRWGRARSRRSAAAS